MRTYTLLILFILICTKSIGQQGDYADSLRARLQIEALTDSARVVVLTRLHEHLMFSHPEEALSYAKEEIRIYERTGLKMAYGLGHLHVGDYYFNKAMNDSALYHYHLAKATFEETKKRTGLIFVNFTIGNIYMSQGNYDSALGIFYGDLEIIKKINNPNKQQFLAASFYSIGTCHLEKGNLNIALSESLRALKIFESIEDQLRKADTFFQLGKIEDELGHLDAAFDYFEQAEIIYKDNNDIIYRLNALNALGKIHKKQGKLVSAKSVHEEVIALARSGKIQDVLAESLHDLGLLFIDRSQYTSAEEALHESKQIAEKEKLSYQSIQTYEALARLALARDNYDLAGKYADNAIRLGKKNKVTLLLPDLYLLRSSIFEGVGRHKEAIFNLKEANLLSDSIASVKKIQQVEELKTIYETEKKEAALALQEKEIEALNAQAKADSLSKRLFGTGMVSAIGLLGLSVFGYRQRIKKNRIAKERNEEILKKEIEYKQKELTSQTLHLVQKNTFIQELRENIEKIQAHPDQFRSEFRRILMLLKKENASDNDWEIFQSYFAEVHNDFDQKLKHLYPEISAKDIRLGALLRMELTSKEIAVTLNVLPDSILKSKYRLKKKLGLDRGTDLSAFLASL